MKVKIGIEDIKKHLTGDDLKDYRYLVKFYNATYDKVSSSSVLIDLIMEKYNNILNDVMKRADKKSNYHNLSKFATFSKIILKYPLEEEEIDEEDKVKITLNETINLSEEFFSSINPEYAYRLRNMLNEPLLDQNNKKIGTGIVFNSEENPREDYPDYPAVMDTGMAVISYNNTLDDVVSLVHEATHKLSYQNIIKPSNIPTKIANIFREAPPIVMELLLRDYLQEKYPLDDVNKYFLFRLTATYEAALRILLEYNLDKIYQENNKYIDITKIKEYFNSLDSSDISYQLFSNIDEYNDDLIDIIDPEEDNDHLEFESAATYVMGSLLAFNLYNKIKSDSNNLIILFKLIDILGDNDLNIKKDLKILECMGLNFFDTNTGKLKVDEELLKELSSSYQEIYDNLLLSNQNKTR